MGNASRLAIGMVELNSIARGIETCDYMVKAAQVDLIRSSTVCPGKYMVLIAGDTGDVKAAMAEGIKRGGECVVDTLTLPNVHPQVIQAISMTTQVEKPGAVGVLEFYSVASALIDENGILPAEATVDGVHFTKAWYQKWLEYLMCHTVTPEAYQAAQTQ